MLEGNVTQSFERSKSKLFVVLSQPLNADEPRTITVRYEALPAAGLRFFPDQIYTSIPSDWMPCNDVPSERATLHLTLTAPHNMKAAASGRLIGTRASGEQTITEWQLDSPADPSSFGFALGSFAESTSGNLHILAAGTEIPSSAQILQSTGAAMLYLAERTGKPYPAQIYSQVFIHGDLIHSLASGLTLLPESYAQGLKKQPEDLWLLTEELAHQWYGVAITPKDWSNLWLSDGISAYLADAFLGQRFGKQKYQLEIEHSRNIFDQLHAQGKDRPLSDSDSELTSRQEAEGELPAHKGASFLYLVDQQLGDDAFWQGLRLYTSNQWSHSATSDDLQKAFDAVNTKSTDARTPNRKSKSKTNPKGLDHLFDLWVYGIPDPVKR